MKEVEPGQYVYSENDGMEVEGKIVAISGTTVMVAMRTEYDKLTFEQTQSDFKEHNGNCWIFPDDYFVF